ncbi:MAG TPA: hypothetical protein VE863_23065 [Pyrinomonadaceae bacterium]|jgi:hypothetical protein|nr:hypothetical protein [Pyrinomonadaceae bacterium]
MKKLCYVLGALLLITPIAQVASQTKKDLELAKKKQKTLEQVKKDVNRLGVGSKAKATITLHDNTKVKGYVYSVSNDDFVTRDRKTDAPTTIRFADVYKVDDNRGHRNAMLATIFVGIGAAVTIAAVIGAIARNE